VPRPFSDDLACVNYPQPRYTVRTPVFPSRHNAMVFIPALRLASLLQSIFRAPRPSLAGSINTSHDPLSASQVYDVRDAIGVPFKFPVWDYRLCLLRLVRTWMLLSNEAPSQRLSSIVYAITDQ
jgi:hypothetical protein